MSPPKDVRPDLSLGNMILWFAPITRPYQHPIKSQTDENTVIEFPRNQARRPKTDGGWQPFLRAWRETFSGPILILDYYHWSGKSAERSAYFYMRPDVIAADLRFYRELGLNGSIGVEPCPLTLPNGWNQYLKAKLLWDPSQDVEDLERQYDQSLYGSCARPARKCLSAVADIVNAERDDVESVEKLKEAAARFAVDTEACARTPIIEARLERISLWLRYIALRKDYYRCLHKKEKEAAEKAGAELMDFVDANRAKMAQDYNEVDFMIPPEVAKQRKLAKEKAEAARGKQPDERKGGK
jgi:hypothetical protein